MYHVLAYYHFNDIEDPHGEVERHKDFFKNRDVTCRIYINEAGINGQMSAAPEDAEAYMKWMQEKKEFEGMPFKVHHWHEQAFPRCTVKYRKQLVAYDREIDLSKRGEHISPKEWRRMLEEDENKVLVDVRNNYESKVGYFDGAEIPPCATFREFDAYADELKTRVDPKKTPVMMYCTGGIRCELYSAALVERGFEKVYQLDGGVINYGLKEGGAHWLGKLFVFDDRLSVAISDEPTPIVGKCHHCHTPTESYLNCANMDCNELFLCCKECIAPHEGCCQKACQETDRKRPYQIENPHKPFRRSHVYAS